MSGKNYNFRESVYATIILVYLLPILLYGQGALGVMSKTKSWGVLSVGLVVGIFGALLLILMVRSWELSLRKQLATAAPQLSTPPARVPESAWDQQTPHSEKILPLPQHSDPVALEQLEDALDQIHLLKQQLADQKAHQQRVSTENQQLKQEIERAQFEASSQQEERRHHLEERDSLLGEYKETIAEQRGLLEQRQDRIKELEEKVHDLQYEVKTLLKLGEMGHQARQRPLSHPVLDIFDAAADSTETERQSSITSADDQIHASFDAQQQLTRCIETASSIHGAAHLTEGSSLGVLSPESNAIDLRRLSDGLRVESGAPVFLYSTENKKVLLANNLIKGLLGWSPERFAADFSRLVQQGWQEWLQTVEQVVQTGTSQSAPLILKSKSGHDILVHAYVGLVEEGTFQNHVMVILAQQ